VGHAKNVPLRADDNYADSDDHIAHFRFLAVWLQPRRKVAPKINGNLKSKGIQCVSNSPFNAFYGVYSVIADVFTHVIWVSIFPARLRCTTRSCSLSVLGVRLATG
jgi:hypothetical protein